MIVYIFYISDLKMFRLSLTWQYYIYIYSKDNYKLQSRNDLKMLVAIIINFRNYVLALKTRQRMLIFHASHISQIF